MLRYLQKQNRWAFNFCKREVLDYNRSPQPIYNQNISAPESIIIHPIFYPNKGPQHEIFLAEEAIGLAKSINWNINLGPFSELQEKKNETIESEPEEPIKIEDLKDGDYIYDGIFKGTYYKQGMILDFSSESDFDDEWRNLVLRSKIAKSSITKMRATKQRTFFGAGKLNQIAQHIKQNNINCVFINSELTAQQNKNIQKYFTAIKNNQQIDATFKKRKNPLIPSDIESQTEQSDNDEPESLHQSEGQVKVFDRYLMILQIFAKRAQSRLAKAQIEFSFIQFLKMRIKTKGITYNPLYNIFKGDLLTAETINLETISNKQRGGRNQMQGEGETQQEIQKRLIQKKEQDLKEIIEQELKSKENLRIKRKQILHQLPRIAIIGYTNAGKSQLMNLLLDFKAVTAKDMLFQTLDTTSRKLYLSQGSQAVLLDTIGFISNLPHDLVDSFQNTLSEVLDADLLLHVRDVSNPNTEEQYKTVIKVLKQISPEILEQNRIIDVWNKIDLLQEVPDIDKILNSDFPIVPISALYGTNLKKLEGKIIEKINLLTGKKMYSLVNGVDNHGERLKWLYKNGNISQIQNEQYDYYPCKKYPQGSVKFEILLDDVTYKRYQAHFGEYKKEKKEDYPPKDWQYK